jgi:hypothetical protein
VVATDSLQPMQATVLYYAPGYEANAKSLAKLLNLQDSQVQALPTGAKLAKNQPGTAGVVLLLGPEVAPVVGVVATGASTTVAGGTGASTSVAGKGVTTTVAGRTTVTTTTTP